MQNFIFQGIPASSGKRESTAYILPVTHFYAEDVHIEENQVSNEIKRLNKAVQLASEEIRGLRKIAVNHLDETVLPIFDAHLAILDDEHLFHELGLTIQTYKLTAESALYKKMAQMMRIFHTMETPLMQDRVLDIKDIALRVLNLLTGQSIISELPRFDYSIVFAEELLPSQLLLMLENKVKGIIVSKGGVESHPAILARALQIPMIVGVEEDHLKRFNNGMVVSMDGDSGTFTVEMMEEEE